MKKIGMLLVENKVITQDQLEKALQYQEKNGGKIGVILVEMGFTTVTTLKKYLGLRISEES